MKKKIRKNTMTGMTKNVNIDPNDDENNNGGDENESDEHLLAGP